MKYSLHEQRLCAERELKRRKQVYPRTVRRVRVVVDSLREIEVMAAIVDTLRELEKAELLV
jgi:hypothetical protein